MCVCLYTVPKDVEMDPKLVEGKDNPNETPRLDFEQMDVDNQPVNSETGDILL